MNEISLTVCFFGNVTMIICGSFATLPLCHGSLEEREKACVTLWFSLHSLDAQNVEPLNEIISVQNEDGRLVDY